MAEGSEAPRKRKQRGDEGPTPRERMERARAVNDLVQQQSIEMKKRVEDAEK